MKNYLEIIRGLREDRDLKQIEIANVIGTTQQHYSKYETGEYELPIRALVLLADYYGVPTDYLLGRKDWTSGVPGLERKLTPKQTAGEVLSDMLSLGAAGREAVTEYITLQKLKECCAKKREKDGCPFAE